MIRPVAKYCSAVFHPMITAADSHELECIQMQVLKGIYGWNISYEKLLERSGLERLDARRESRFEGLAQKMSESARFTAWFPLRLYRDGVATRSMERYKIYRSSTERYLNLPLNLMRRKLNELYLL